MIARSDVLTIKTDQSVYSSLRWGVIQLFRDAVSISELCLDVRALRKMHVVCSEKFCTYKMHGCGTHVKLFEYIL